MFKENSHETGGSGRGPEHENLKSPEKSELKGLGNPEFSTTEQKYAEAKELLGYPPEYDPNDKQGMAGGESGAMQPYKVGEEYGYDVYYYPMKSWFVLHAPLPSVFYLDQQKMEVARNYPNYEIQYFMGSQMLVRLEPFVTYK
jgi:hypothetical protein